MTTSQNAIPGGWQDKMKALKEPFAPSDIEWRVGRAGLKDGRPWASVLAYVTNRAIQDRLDAVVGPGCWQNTLTPVFLEKKAPKLDDCGSHIGFICGLGVLCGTEWIWKSDVCDCSAIEPLKGGVSGAMKRAAVHWGIGRYLYNLPNAWAEFTDGGEHSCKIEGTWFKWNPPALPGWAIPGGSGAVVAPESPWEGVPPSSAAPTPQKPMEPIPPAPLPGEWGTVEIHFGKNKGRTLGEIGEKSLRWYIEEWQPKPFKGKTSDADLRLRAALDLARKSLPAPADETAE